MSNTKIHPSRATTKRTKQDGEYRVQAGANYFADDTATAVDASGGIDHAEYRGLPVARRLNDDYVNICEWRGELKIGDTVAMFDFDRPSQSDVFRGFATLTSALSNICKYEMCDSELMFHTYRDELIESGILDETEEFGMYLVSIAGGQHRNLDAFVSLLPGTYTDLDDGTANPTMRSALRSRTFYDHIVPMLPDAINPQI